MLGYGLYFLLTRFCSLHLYPYTSALVSSSRNRALPIAGVPHTLEYPLL